MVSNCYSNAKIDKIIILNALLFVFYRFRLVVPLVAGCRYGIVGRRSVFVIADEDRFWMVDNICFMVSVNKLLCVIICES